MTRLTRAAAIAVLFAAGMATARLALPSNAFACLCAMPPNANAFTGQEDAVLLGTVGAPEARGLFAFHVERWFKGGSDAIVPMHSAMQPVGNGPVSFNTCGLDLQVGQRLILAASRDDLSLSPSACSPHADANSPEGGALIAAATQAFGAGLAPGELAGPGPTGGGFDLVLIAVVLVAVAVVAIGVVVGLSFLRREPNQGS